MPKLGEGREYSVQRFANVSGVGKLITLKPYCIVLRNGALCCTQMSLVQPLPSTWYRASMPMQAVNVLMCVCVSVLTSTATRKVSMASMNQE